jgi:hypothetical protein
MAAQVALRRQQQQEEELGISVNITQEQDNGETSQQSQSPEVVIYDEASCKSLIFISALILLTFV